MSITSLRQDGVLFAADMPPEIDAILQEAVVLYEDTERAEEALKKAFDMAKGRLEVYVALYKFYFYKNRIDDAEAVALDSLKEAAQQGGFSSDWSVLTAESTQWTPAPDAQRFYLYTLKALAFVNLRKGNNARAEALLDKLLELDPKDQVGGSVIRDLALGMED
jgi:tetratricopeptide (TPR) repeat protein